MYSPSSVEVEHYEKEQLKKGNSTGTVRILCSRETRRNLGNPNDKRTTNRSKGTKKHPEKKIRVHPDGILFMGDYNR